jgi:hypothetical protein
MRNCGFFADAQLYQTSQTARGSVKLMSVAPLETVVERGLLQASGKRVFVLSLRLTTLKTTATNKT